MAKRPSFTMQDVLDEEARDASLSSPTSPKKASDGTSPASRYARASLGVESSAPRHGSIAGIGVGVSSPIPTRSAASKAKRLDPSDPSTWTKPHSQSFDAPRPSPESVRAGAPAIRLESDADKSLGKGSLGLTFDGSSIAPAQAEQTPTLATSGAAPSSTTSHSMTTTAPPNAQGSPSSTKTDSNSPAVAHVSPSSPQSSGLGIPPDQADDRRSSNQSTSFSSVTTDSDRIGRISKEEDRDNEHAVQESSDEDHSSSDREESSPVAERGRKRKSSRDDTSSPRDSEPQSQQSPVEPEIRVEDTSEGQQTSPLPPDNSGKLSETKPAKVAPKSGIARAASPAALSAIGDDDAELKRAKELILKTSPLDQTVKDRTVKMIIRGEWESFQDTDDEQTEFRHEPRLYLVCSDLSNEATYALEWTVGTLLKDGDTLLVISAVEDENAPKHKPDEEPTQEIRMESARAAEEATATMETLTKQTTNQQGTKPELKPKIASLTEARSRSRGSRPPSKRDQDRLNSVERLEQDFLKYVRKTTLQVRTMIEVLHCRSPKHLILNAIDELEPTLVVVGTRGQSSIQGVMMGSFSNYLVTKSSIPVMVARRRLKKARHAKVSSQQIRMTNNLMPFGVKQKRKSLTQARID